MKTLSAAFYAANAVAVIGWLVLFGYPFWPQAARLAVLSISVTLLCVLYCWFAFFVRHLREPGTKTGGGGFSSLTGVVNLFRSPRVVLAGWIHYLAFDLMVGLYIVTDAARVGIIHWWLVPALFLTLMFGPAGLLLYLVMLSAMVPGSWLLSAF
jgi:hypothetical protein